ncbi:hypothetical protein HJC23_011277 [Cyclotella cryptica]|uniref:Uncharacterized protein n=1 Tax=Cyclotella cryptica TaxID=29204 RepID=A0ABD3QVU0_9STRA|eukprot:CCRYP_001669-RA/>CCRYP_001669-RA protein AED:0.04 eAED:0.04 QI:76/1/1/1/0.75/0.6/5/1455/1026
MMNVNNDSGRSNGHPSSDSSSGILTEHNNFSPSSSLPSDDDDAMSLSLEFDPFAVDHFKILHEPGASASRGRNIVQLLAERSCRGSASSAANGGGWRRGPICSAQPQAAEEPDEEHGEPASLPSSRPTTPMIVGTPPRDTDNGQAFGRRLSPPPHRTARQLEQTSTITSRSHTNNDGITLPTEKLDTATMPLRPAHVTVPTSLHTEITLFIEHSSATRFKASYLKHLGGAPAPQIVTRSPRLPSQRGMTREQLETHELLRQHLRQAGRDLPGRERDFPRRMWNPLQRRGSSNNSNNRAADGGRWQRHPPPHNNNNNNNNQRPSQPQPNPNPAVSTISIAFSPDGRTLASTHGDHTVKITCAHTGNLIRTLEGHPRTPWTVKYHPTNHRIVASGCLGFQVRVWDWNYRTEAVRMKWRREREKRYGARYYYEGDAWEREGSRSPRGVMDPAWRGRRSKDEKTKEVGAADMDTEGEDYAVAALRGMGIPTSDPVWYDVQSEVYNHDDGIGICLNMIRLNHAIISLAFHPSGEILAVASGSTLHLWDYDEESRRKRRGRQTDETIISSSTSTTQSERINNHTSPQQRTPQGQRESESRILYRDRNSDFPTSRTVDIRHESALRCVHFPPCGKTLIVGGVNPQSANEGLVHRHPRGRGGMSGGGMSFHLRLWDFDLDAVLNPEMDDGSSGTNGSNYLGGVVSDEGEVTWNFSETRRPLRDPRIIIPRVLLYNDGGFDLSRDGKIISACAEYWLPEGIDSAMELLHSQQQIEDDDGVTMISKALDDNRARSPSFESASGHYTSPSPLRPSFSTLSDPRTPPPNSNFTSLEPPPPPGNRNLPRVYNPNHPNGPGSNLITTTHNPHPLSMVAPTHPAYENEGGRYVPHVVTISLDASPPLRETEFKMDLTRSIIEMESMRRHPKLGRLLNAAPLDGTKASGVTCVKLSPSAEYCLLGYGVRENLPSVNGNDPRHPVTSIYNVNKGMLHVSTLTSVEDDVNIARFHPESGHGFVYGTKQGRVRILSTRPWNQYHL